MENKEMFSFIYENELVECFNDVVSIELFNNGKHSVFDKENKYFDKTIANIKNIFRGARLEPAFSVSLHDETVKAMNNGKWIKFNFGTEKIVNELSFNSLIFELFTTQSLNIIREYNGKYEGRCIYVAFDTIIDMEKELF